MQISLGESICQEFSDTVLVSNKYIETEDEEGKIVQDRIEEIKCCIDVRYFPDLMDRMAEVGYAMVQVQKDRSLQKCFVWFEPCSENITLIDEVDDEDEDEDGDFFEYFE